MEFRRVQSITFFVLLIGIGYLFYLMIEPYLFPIFWAAVIGALFYPVYTWLQSRIKSKNIASTAVVILVILVVLIPASAFLGVVATQAVGIYATVSNPATINTIINGTNDLLRSDLVTNVIGDTDLQQQFRSLSSSLTAIGVEALKVGSRTTVQGVIGVLIMLYTLFYFFKDGAQWLRRITLLLPLGDKNEELLYERFVSTAKATLKGTILLGFIQGAMGGILFFIVDIPAAAFWGLVMIVLSIIPAVGSFLVWFPAAVWMLVSGNVWQCVVLLIGGAIISITDNLLRPPLVGKDLQMHPALILFSTLGGLALFGISGVVVGPMIAAFFIAVLHMYEQKYKHQLQERG